MYRRFEIALLMRERARSMPALLLTGGGLVYPPENPAAADRVPGALPVDAGAAIKV
jgi:hypothetical protein